CARFGGRAAYGQSRFDVW
nr:immunoglobulin heavy chain junction region [Macaca mulatta]MOW76106.1 immunoglobulin heavy chain junction region [Macaca mulatta]MOW79065.1 immunoglobulin heavy chain junction region [Macaca mulatta]MOW79071.1 immunoglobulin heavy chain junction region [Macaca mulatta]MOW80621.1 immunoglobulin heavy chain junction region [Macaca mulatta]